MFTARDNLALCVQHLAHCSVGRPRRRQHEMTETGKYVCDKSEEAASCVEKLTSKDNLDCIRRHVTSMEKITDNLEAGAKATSFLKAVDLFAKFGKAMPYVGAIAAAISMMFDLAGKEKKPELKLLEKVNEQVTRLQKTVRII